MNRCTYLGNVAHVLAGSDREITVGLILTDSVVGSLRIIWRRQYLRERDIHVFQPLMVLDVLYICKTWILNGESGRQVFVLDVYIRIMEYRRSKFVTGDRGTGGET